MVWQLGACLHAASPSCTLVDLFGGSTDNLQQEKEDLYDVNINGERSEHVLLWTDGVFPVPYQQLCVVR